MAAKRPGRALAISGLAGDADCLGVRFRLVSSYENIKRMTQPTGRPHGGPRPNSGRPKGSKNKSTLKKQAALARAAARNLMPVEYLLSIMRDRTLPRNVRMDAAKWAAPFLSPRLSSIEVMKSVKGMSRQELEWAIADARGSVPPRPLGWQPKVVTGGRD